MNERAERARHARASVARCGGTVGVAHRSVKHPGVACTIAAGTSRRESARAFAMKVIYFPIKARNVLAQLVAKKGGVACALETPAWVRVRSRIAMTRWQAMTVDADAFFFMNDTRARRERWCSTRDCDCVVQAGVSSAQRECVSRLTESFGVFFV